MEVAVFTKNVTMTKVINTTGGVDFLRRAVLALPSKVFRTKIP